jgi:WD40 repeat protein
VAVSPDGSRVAVVLGDRLSIFDLASGNLLQQVPAVPYSETLPKYSQDGSRLAVFTADLGREITVYDTTTWAPIRTIPIPGEGNAVVDFSPDGRWIASAEYVLHPPVLIFDVDSGEQVAVLNEPLAVVDGVCCPPRIGPAGDLVFTPDSGLLFISGGLPEGEESLLVRRSVSVWDTATWQQVGTIYGDMQPYRMIMASDGMSFSVDAGRWLLIWRPEPPALTAARAALLRFDAALQAGDYATAGLEYGNSYLVGAASSDSEIFGGDPAGELETICSMKPDPCPPLRQILLGLYSEEFGGCQFFVHYSAPDGSLYLDRDGMAAQVVATWCDPSIDLYQIVQLSLFDLAFP